MYRLAGGPAIQWYGIYLLAAPFMVTQSGCGLIADLCCQKLNHCNTVVIAV